MAQDGDEPVEPKAGRVLHIGPVDDPQSRDFSTGQRVLYIGPPPLAFLALAPLAVVGGDVPGIGGSVAGEVAGVLGKPQLGSEVLVLEVIGIVPQPLLLGLPLTLAAAPLSEARLLLLASPRIGPKPATAKKTPLEWRFHDGVTSASWRIAEISYGFRWSRL
jgi:hypothetical protein